VIIYTSPPDNPDALGKEGTNIKEIADFEIEVFGDM